MVHRSPNYAETTDPDWNEEAARTFTPRLEPEDEPAEIVLEGPCPNCHGPTVHYEPLVVIQGMQPATREQQREAARVVAHAMREAGLEWQIEDRARRREITVICSCGYDHPDTPKGKHGCGAAWVVTADWEE